MVEFNAEAGEAAKERGRQQAQGALPFWGVNLLDQAREVARSMSRMRGHVNADDLCLWFQHHENIDLAGRLGPAMGVMFRGLEWEWTGQFVKSIRVTNRRRLLRVWRWKGGEDAVPKSG